MLRILRWCFAPLPPPRFTRRERNNPHSSGCCALYCVVVVGWRSQLVGLRPTNVLYGRDFVPPGGCFATAAQNCKQFCALSCVVGHSSPLSSSLRSSLSGSSFPLFVVSRSETVPFGHRVVDPVLKLRFSTGSGRTKKAQEAGKPASWAKSQNGERRLGRSESCDFCENNHFGPN